MEGKQNVNSLYNINIILFLFFRHLLLCRVTLGKSFLQFNAMKMAHAPPGHHSVMGRPSSGGLNFPEFVVYRGEQVSCIMLSFYTGFILLYLLYHHL